MGTPSVHVAVIARPDSTTLLACLESLRQTGVAAPDVLPIGSGGPACARNEALTGCDADVLALVEDDVLVERGWLTAVTHAWTDDRRGVAGGPLSGPAATATVDGPSPTYPGANVSFRAAALRGAGGFWPARGDAEARDWFSEEHEVQRELQRAGWTIAYVPEMAAVRTGPGPTLARRFRTGARARRLGINRSRTTAAHALASGVAGAPFGRRTERLGRAAENLGYLAGARLVSAQFAPIASSSPFRASVPMPPRRRIARRRGHHQPVILMYHRVAELRDDPLALAVHPEHFAQQLEILRKRGVVALEDVASGSAAPDAIAITFDDGYRDNLVLRSVDVPVTLFVATGNVDREQGFWWDALTRVCREQAGRRVDVADRAFILGEVGRRQLSIWLQPQAPEQIQAILASLDATTDERPLTASELRELARHVTIGAHTRSHRSLRHATLDEQRAEIERSRDDVQRLVGMRPTAFSYPFGVPGEAFDQRTVSLVAQAGFSCAVQNGSHNEHGSRFTLARHVAPNVNGPAFERWLDGLRRG